MRTGRCHRCRQVKVLRSRNLCGSCYSVERMYGDVGKYPVMEIVPIAERCTASWHGNAYCTGRAGDDGLCDFHRARQGKRAA